MTRVYIHTHTHTHIHTETAWRCTALDSSRVSVRVVVRNPRVVRTAKPVRTGAHVCTSVRNRALLSPQTPSRCGQQPAFRNECVKQTTLLTSVRTHKHTLSSEQHDIERTNHCRQLVRTQTFAAACRKAACTTRNYRGTAGRPDLKGVTRITTHHHNHDKVSNAHAVG